MGPSLQRIWPRIQFRLTNSTYVPYSFVPTPMKSCMRDCRPRLRALLSTPVTGFDKLRCRQTGELAGLMLDWIWKSESIRGAAGGLPGDQETAGSIALLLWRRKQEAGNS